MRPGNTDNYLLYVRGHPKIHFITDSGIWLLRGEGVYYGIEPNNVFNHILQVSMLDNVKQRPKQPKKRFSLLTVEGF